jgi:hypothetical protein
MEELLSALDLIWNKDEGLAKLAKLTGIPKTTIHSWKRRRSIPDWRIEPLEEKLRTLDEFKDLNRVR